MARASCERGTRAVRAWNENGDEKVSFCMSDHAASDASSDASSDALTS